MVPGLRHNSAAQTREEEKLLFVESYERRYFLWCVCSMPPRAICRERGCYRKRQVPAASPLMCGRSPTHRFLKFILLTCWIQLPWAKEENKEAAGVARRVAPETVPRKHLVRLRRVLGSTQLLMQV